MRRRLGIAIVPLLLAGCRPVEAPKAVAAGPSEDVPVGHVATLDGSFSTDPQGRALVYGWRLLARPAGSRAELGAPDIATTWLRPDAEGEYRARLTVSNGVLTAAAEVSLVARCGVAPPQVTLHASEGRDTGEVVALRATVADADNDAPCSLGQQAQLAWAFEALPAGSRVAFQGAGSATPFFVPDLPGLYRVRATATDSTGRTGAAALDLAIGECGSHPPVLGAIQVERAVVGEAALLSVSVTDPDTAAPCSEPADYLYSWSFTARPAGSTARFNDAALAGPSFVPDVGGEYGLQVTATDPTGRAGSQRATVTVSGCGTGVPAVTAVQASPAAPATGQAVSLTAQVSDADNEAPCGAGQTASLRWSLVRQPAGSQARLQGASGLVPWIRGDVPGEYAVKVVAQDSTGRASAPFAFEWSVSQCGSAAPQPAASAQPAAPGTGRPVVLSATATDSDNDPPCSASQAVAYGWSFVSVPAGSRARVLQPAAATTSFVPDVPGPYLLRLVATDSSGRTGQTDLAVTASACGTAAPALVAGAEPADPATGRPVRLLADASDADNEPGCAAGQTVTLAWTFESLPAGSQAAIAPADAPRPSFVPDVPGAYVALVAATDSTGLATTRRVTVTASACGASAPVAAIEAGTTQPAAGQAVALRALASDADNDPSCGAGETFTYTWSFEALPAGSAAKIAPANAERPWFRADRPGDYLVRLTVLDSAGHASRPATLLVSASECGAAAPTAMFDAEPLAPATGQPVRLTALADDADGACGQVQTLAYRWSLTALPPGSTATLNAPAAAAPSFTPDRPGPYEVQLVATDSTGRVSKPAVRTLIASECGTAAPVAQPSAQPLAPAIGEPVRLTAAADDADNGPSCPGGQTFAWEWSLAAAPRGSLVALEGGAGSPSFVPDLAGEYVASLVAIDSTGRRSAPQTVTVQARACGSAAPTASAVASPASSAIGRPVSIVGSATDTDNDAGCLAGQTFAWSWGFESLPAGSRATLTAPASARPSFVPDLPGDYAVRGKVVDSTGRASAPLLVHVAVSACGGNAPSATIAFSPTAAATGTPVSLVPSVADPDNADCQTDANPVPRQAYAFAWTLLSAPPASRAALSGADAREPSLVPDVPGPYAVRLVVADSTGRVSAPAEATFTASTCGTGTPSVTASAEPSSVPAGEPVRLLATFTDTDNAGSCLALAGGRLQALSVSWRVVAAPAGSRAQLLAGDLAAPSLVPDVAGPYTVEAAVTDSTGRTGRATASFTAAACGRARPTAAPTVDAASTLIVGGRVALHANAADGDTDGCDPDQKLSYRWWLSEAPAGSRAVLVGVNSADPWFQPDLDGAYVATVVVTDSTGLSSDPTPRPVTIATCGERPPNPLVVTTLERGATTPAAASVGPLFVPACHRVLLDGRQSSDPDLSCHPTQTPDRFEYRWRLEAGPVGTVLPLGAGVATTTFDPDVPATTAGPYVVALDVSDGANWSTEPARASFTAETFTITAIDKPLVCQGTSFTELFLTGTGFLEINGVGPAVAIDNNAVSAAVVAASCRTETVVPNTRSCTQLRLYNLVSGNYGVGQHTVRVTNPTARTCVRTITFSVGPPPSISTVSPSQACQGPLTLTIDGQRFVPGTAVTLGTQAADAVTFVSETRLLATFNYPPLGWSSVTVSNGSGCSSTKANAVRVFPNPSIYFVDPEVTYNGISLRGIAYVSQVNVEGASSVTSAGIRPTGTTQPLQPVNYVYSDARHQLQIDIPSGLATGGWELVITDAQSCTGRLADAFQVTDKLTLALSDGQSDRPPPVDPPFGWTSSTTPVTLYARDPAPPNPAPPPAYMQQFKAVPRAYLTPMTGTGSLAVPLVSVAWTNDPVRMTAVVPQLATGFYRLVVVNPDGSVGVANNAFRVTADRPPVIDALVPASIPAQPATVLARGSGFRSPATAGLSCLLSGATRPTPYAATVTGVTATQVTLSVPAIPAFAVCVVRVTNPDGTYGEYSALGTTTSSLNIPSFTLLSPRLNTARRAPAVAAGRATRASRFLYAIGGDTGTTAGALASQEVSVVDAYGTPGPWRVLPTSLPAGRTLAAVQPVGRFLYLAGGAGASGAPTGSVLRAELLDMSTAPTVTDLLLQLTPTGVGPGVWYYRIAAKMEAGHATNPGGETLPSEPQPIRVPATLPMPVSITLTWSAVPGAAKYYIYRTPTAGLPSGNERLIGEVTAPTHEFTDTGLTAGAQATRRWGDLGEWATMPSLANARMGHGLAGGPDPSNGNKHYLYALLGRGASGLRTDYEYLPLTLGGEGSQTPGTWSAVALGTGSSGREWLSAVSVDATNCSKVTSGTWVFLGPGLGATGVNDGKYVDAGLVGAGGPLVSKQQVDATAPKYAGYGMAIAADQIYLLGGGAGTSGRSTMAAEVCGNDACSNNIDFPPNLAGFNAGVTLASDRLLPGTATESAHVFLVGGVDALGQPLATVESTIW